MKARLRRIRKESRSILLLIAIAILGLGVASASQTRERTSKDNFLTSQITSTGSLHLRSKRFPRPTLGGNQYYPLVCSKHNSSPTPYPPPPFAHGTPSPEGNPLSASFNFDSNYIAQSPPLFDDNNPETITTGTFNGFDNVILGQLQFVNGLMVPTPIGRFAFHIVNQTLGTLELKLIVSVPSQSQQGSLQCAEFCTLKPVVGASPVLTGAQEASEYVSVASSDRTFWQSISLGGLNALSFPTADTLWDTINPEIPNTDAVDFEQDYINIVGNVTFTLEAFLPCTQCTFSDTNFASLQGSRPRGLFQNAAFAMNYTYNGGTPGQLFDFDFGDGGPSFPNLQGFDPITHSSQIDVGDFGVPFIIEGQNAAQPDPNWYLDPRGAGPSFPYAGLVCEDSFQENVGTALIPIPSYPFELPAFPNTINDSVTGITLGLAHQTWTMVYLLPGGSVAPVHVVVKVR